MQACEWDKDSWGGGEYEPGNAKFSGAFNFTIIDDSYSADKKKFKAKNWIDYGGGFRVIESFKISDKFLILSKLEVPDNIELKDFFQFYFDQGYARIEYNGETINILDASEKKIDKPCDWCDFGKNKDLCGASLTPDEKFFSF